MGMKTWPTKVRTELRDRQVRHEGSDPAKSATEEASLAIGSLQTAGLRGNPAALPSKPCPDSPIELVLLSL